MKNTLTIRWKDYLGKNMVQCGNPQSETFKNVPSVLRAWEIISRRAKENILHAVYNGQFLIGGKRIKQQKVAAVVAAPGVVVTAKPKTMLSGLKKLNPIKFVRNLFTRQKH